MQNVRGRTGHVSDRPSRLSIFARRQRKRIRPALALLVLVVLVAGGYRLARDVQSEERFAPIRARLIALAPLKIRQIVVTGRSLTSDADLRTALGTVVGQPILGFSLPAARDRIDALPFVDHATIERHLPGTIVVTLAERRPFAVWQHDGHFKLIDRDGNPVADSGMTGKDAQAFLHLPLVVGLGANTAASALLDALAAQPEVSSRAVAMTRVGERRWNLLLRDGSTVLLPEGEEAPALARLSTYQAQYQLLERPVAEIDMRLPDRMVIRQRPPADPAPDDAASGAATTGTTPPAGTPTAAGAGGASATATPAAAPATAATPVKPAPPKAVAPTPRPSAPRQPAPVHPAPTASVPAQPRTVAPAPRAMAPPSAGTGDAPSGSALAPPEPLPPPMAEPLPLPAARKRA